MKYFLKILFFSISSVFIAHAQLPLTKAADHLNDHTTELYRFLSAPENQPYLQYTGAYVAGWPIFFATSFAVQKFVPDMGAIHIYNKRIPIKTALTLIAAYGASYLPLATYLYYIQQEDSNPGPQ